MAKVALQALLHEDKNNPATKMLAQWALNLGPQPFGSDTLLWDIRYLGDLRSLYGHALLGLTKWFKSKIEMVQEQKTI